jgi:hypothetical protein
MSTYLITLAVCKPGNDARLATVRNTLANFGRIIGGEVSEMKLSNGYSVLYDRLSKDKGRRYNCTIEEKDIYGTFLITDSFSGHWVSLSEQPILLSS